MEQKTQVIIADDHQIFLDGLKSLLEKDDSIELTGTAPDGVELLRLLETQSADVVVLDISMPNMDGKEAAARIRELYPHIKILILSMHKDADRIVELRDLGVSGYILKDKGSEELVEAITELSKGGSFWGRQVTETVFLSSGKQQGKSAVSFTRREKELLPWFGAGKTVPEIAEANFVATTTVETHKRNLLTKLNLRNNLELVRWAVENGYVAK